MAKKSKTQRAKASAARQARKAERERAEELSEQEASSQAADSAKQAAEEPKRSILKKRDDSAASDAKESSESKKASKKADDAKPKKKRFQFFRDVKAEMKRVTWPTRIDVLRWSGVVVAALVFFGVFTAILDNLIVTPLLVLISGADPSSIDWFSSFSYQETTVTTDGSALDASSSADASGAIDSSSAGTEGAEGAEGAEDTGSADATTEG